MWERERRREIENGVGCGGWAGDGDGEKLREVFWVTDLLHQAVSILTVSLPWWSSTLQWPYSQKKKKPRVRGEEWRDELMTLSVSIFYHTNCGHSAIWVDEPDTWVHFLNLGHKMIILIKTSHINSIQLELFANHLRLLFQMFLKASLRKHRKCSSCHATFKVFLWYKISWFCFVMITTKVM